MCVIAFLLQTPENWKSILHFCLHLFCNPHNATNKMMTTIIITIRATSTQVCLLSAIKQ